ncbi:MAG: hypothetical protein ABI297_03030 [Ginsengibacter sp.]
MQKKNNLGCFFKKFILIIFLFPLHVFSQDISGVWVGYIYNDTTQKNIHYELAINGPDTKVRGYSHTTFIFDKVKNIGVKSMKISVKDNSIYVIDDKFIFNNYSDLPPKGVKMFATLTPSENDTAEVLSGTWGTNATQDYSPLTGTIFLEKKKNSNPRNTIIVAELIRLGLANKLSFLPPLIASNEMLAMNKEKKEVLGKSQSSSSSFDKHEVANASEKEAPINEVAKREKVTDPIINSNAKTTQKKITTVTATLERNEKMKRKENKSLLENGHPRGLMVVKEKPVNENHVTSKHVVETTVNQQIIRKAEPDSRKEKPLVDLKQEEKKVVVPKQETKMNENKLKLTKVEVPDSVMAVNIAKRKIETIRTVEISQDSLVFSLYDNGTVDGDTVSVLLNGAIVMSRVGLLEKAINKTIYLTPEMGDTISVIMYAENLGSIPPNTGLLVIREAKKFYEIRFSGDLNKNSKIILIRKKNK